MNKYQIILRNGVMFTIMAGQVVHNEKTTTFYEKRSDYIPICGISSKDCYVKLVSKEFEYETVKMP